MVKQTPNVRMRVRLSDVAVWVLGTALLAFVARRFWESWKGSHSGRLVPWWMDEEVLQWGIGLWVSALVIAVGLRLGMQMVRLMRGRFDPIPSRRGLATVWRLVALGLLVGVEWVEILAVQPRAIPTSRNVLGAGAFPICGLLMVMGLLAGMKAPGAQRPSRPGRAVGAVLVALLAGLAYLGAVMVLPYLVLIAMDGVFNAMPNVFERRAAVATRVWQAAVPGSVALATCAAVGVMVSRILRRGVSGDRKLGRGEPVGLAAGVAVMIGVAVLLVTRTIPSLNETILDGIQDVLRPMEILAIAMGFAGMSAGIVARALGRFEETTTGEERRSGGRLVVGLLALVLLAMSVAKIVAELQGGGGGGMLSQPPGANLTPSILGWVETIWDYGWYLGAPNAVVLPALLWAGWHAVRLCGPWAGDRASALDEALGQPSGPERVVGLTFALTALALAAMPAFFVTGLVVYQLRLIGPYGP